LGPDDIAIQEKTDEFALQQKPGGNPLESLLTFAPEEVSFVFIFFFTPIFNSILIFLLV